MAKKKPRSKGGKLTKQSQHRLTKIEQRDRQDKLLQQYAMGKSLESIALDEDLDMRAVVNSVSSALDRQVKNYSEPSPQHQFVRYAVFNMDLIKKLEEARRMFLYDPEGKQYSMIISSIRAQHDIYNSIQQKGTELGVIKKRKASSAAVSGSKKHVLKEIQKEAELLLDIVEEFDEHTQFKRRRRIQAKISAREQTTEETQSKNVDSNGRPYAVMIRKVQRQDGIVVRDIEDKFVRKTISGPDGKPKPKSQWTLEDYQRTNIDPPPHLLLPQKTHRDPKVIDAEFTELNKELDQERQKKAG